MDNGRSTPEHEMALAAPAHSLVPSPSPLLLMLPLLAVRAPVSPTMFSCEPSLPAGHVAFPSCSACQEGPAPLLVRSPSPLLPFPPLRRPLLFVALVPSPTLVGLLLSTWQLKAIMARYCVV